MMEENKTIFNYISQIFATYGIIVAIFIVFSLVLGNAAKDYSSLFVLGSAGLSVKTLGQLLLLAVIISLGQIFFLTDRILKKMALLLRNILFFLLVMVVIIVFAVVFRWFPVTDGRAWIGFFTSFGVCTVISVVISRLEEQAENRKMEAALEKYRNKKAE